jgi:hypothetical protein
MKRRTLAIALAILGAIVAAPITASAGDEVLASGAFSGKSGHVTSGGVRVVKTGDGVALVLDPDFKFDGAPDPKLGFGKNGYVKSSQFSELKSNSGEQSYDLPADIQPGDYNEVWVWCEKYSVPLGVANLE